MAEISSSSGSSSSYSSGQTIPNYPERDILQGIAGLSKQYAQSLMDWAQQTYAQTSQVTDANIGRYLDAANMAGGMAKNMIDRYQNIYQPLEDQLVKDANTYASQSRISDEMGRAESQVGQDFNAARLNAEQDLRSYGIDPSAGRYASLNRIANTQEGAAKAAAGTAARVNTENTGRALRGQAIQVGQQYPGQTVNALNQQASDVAGAQNALLANANLGGALMTIPNSYLGTAMGLKNPMSLTGPSSSQSQQRSQSQKPEQQPNQGQGNGANASRGPTAPQAPGAPMKLIGDWTRDFRGIPAPLEGSQGYNPWSDGSTDPFGGIPDYEGWEDQWNNNYQNMLDQFGQDQYGNQQYGADQYNDWGYNPSTDYSGGSDNYANMADWGASDYNDYGGDYAYAKGGAVGAGQGAIPDQPVTGNVVPAAASPSRGAVSDDVTAKVKVGEMIIPEDVTRWKGEEFFQKLIMGSRKARMGAPAKGQPAKSPPGQVGFQSAG